MEYVCGGFALLVFGIAFLIARHLAAKDGKDDERKY
jgi:hypothetical protein